MNTSTIAEFRELFYVFKQTHALISSIAQGRSKKWSVSLWLRCWQNQVNPSSRLLHPCGIQVWTSIFSSCVENRKPLPETVFRKPSDLTLRLMNIQRWTPNRWRKWWVRKLEILLSNCSIGLSIGRYWWDVLGGRFSGWSCHFEFDHAWRFLSDYPD
jgi:hypothetical protein